MISQRARFLVMLFVALSLFATVQRSTRSLSLSATTLKGAAFEVTTLTRDPAVVQPGAVITYDIRVKNISATRKNYASVVVTPPRGFVYQGVTGWGNTCWNLLNGMFICNAVAVNAGAEKSLTLRYRIPADASCASPTLTLQVSVSGAGRLSHVDTLSCARCGDGIVQTGEQCDDGNQADADSCSNLCVSARCGDGKVQSPEQCDDGNAVETDACSTACLTARCGDGVVQLYEQCDDGNVVPGDGCSDRCFTETDLSVLQGNMYRTDRNGYGILTFAVFNNGDSAAQNVIFRASGFGSDDVTFTAPEGCLGGGRSISCTIGELRVRDRRIFKVPVQLSARYGCNQRGPSIYISVVQTNVDIHPQDNIQLAQVVRDCTLRPSSSSSVSSASSVSSQSSAFSDSSDSSASSVSSSFASSVSSWSSVSFASSSSEENSSQASSESSQTSQSSSLMNIPSPVVSSSSAASSLRSAASSSESSVFVSSSSSISIVRSSSSSRSSAQPAACGNAVREGAEECDDGNIIDGDACSKQCKNEVHLTVTLTGSQIPFKGSTQTYRGAVRNDGPAAAHGVTVKIELPSSSAFVQDAALSSCTLADSWFGRSATCPMGSLAPGASVPFSFTVTVTTSYLDRASIIKVSADAASRTLPPWSSYSKDLRWTVRSCGNGTVESDWQEQCDDGNAVDGDGCTKQCKNEVRLSVTLAGSPAPFKGSTQTYGGVVRNDGNATAHGVTVTMKIPSEFAFSASPVNCRVVSSSRDYTTCSWDTLAPGASIPFSFDVTVPSTYAVHEGRIRVDLNTTSQGLPPWSSYSKELGVTVHACGDGIVEEDWREQCDDANTQNADQCPNDCTLPVCGDGVIEGAETCDERSQNGRGGCTASCTRAPYLAACGNGIVDIGDKETCDDGNTVSGDGCRWDCVLENTGLCGNGRIDAGEECDDGNRKYADGCSSCVKDTAAKVTIAGPTIVLINDPASYVIEATNTSPRTEHLSIAVSASIYRDDPSASPLSLAVVSPGAPCASVDANSFVCSFRNIPTQGSASVAVRLTNGNAGRAVLDAKVRSINGYDTFQVMYYTASAQAKTVNAVAPRCGNGLKEITEECDWGPISSTVCTAQCRRAKLNACGNGLKEAGEECDDGNGSSLDGTCDFLCQLQEPCIGETRLGGSCWHDVNGTKSCSEACASFGGFDSGGAAQLAKSAELCKRLYLDRYDATPAELGTVRTIGSDMLCMTHAYTPANSVFFGGGLSATDRYNIYNKRCPCRQ